MWIVGMKEKKPAELPTLWFGKKSKKKRNGEAGWKGSVADDIVECKWSFWLVFSGCKYHRRSFNLARFDLQTPFLRFAPFVPRYLSYVICVFSVQGFSKYSYNLLLGVCGNLIQLLSEYTQSSRSGGGKPEWDSRTYREE